MNGDETLRDEAPTHPDDGRDDRDGRSQTQRASRGDRVAGPRIRLITQERNPFSEKVARALALKKLPFERVLVSEPEEIRQFSPDTHQLPVLEIDGERRAESGAILYWLDEIYPHPPLLSSDSKAAEAQRSLAAWSDSSFAFYWNRWLASQEGGADADGPAEPDGFLDRMRGSLGRSLGLGARPSRSVALEMQVIAGIERRLDDLVGLLGDRDYFHASQPSMADLAVLGMLLLIRYGPIPGSPEMLAARPILVAYVQRLEAATGGASEYAA